jgi:hypothetical protein
MFGRSDVAGDRCHADVIEPCCRRAGPRQAEQLMAAPNQLAHHSCADQAGPTEDKDAQRQPLSVEARPPQDAALTRTERWLRTNIAVQRRGRKKVSNKTGEENFFSICFGLTEPRRMRFSPAMDVLPFYRLIHLTRPNSSLERRK